MELLATTFVSGKRRVGVIPQNPAQDHLSWFFTLPVLCRDLSGGDRRRICCQIVAVKPNRVRTLLCVSWLWVTLRRMLVLRPVAVDIRQPRPAPVAVSNNSRRRRWTTLMLPAQLK